MSLSKNFKKDPLCHAEFISASYGINVLETLKSLDPESSSGPGSGTQIWSFSTV
jgi:hypothetical protein